MNKEQQELLDEVYKNYSILAGMSTQVESLKKEEFINKCKTDSEFSQRWGLKIEERELSGSERYTIARQYGLCPKYSNIGIENCTEEEHYNKYNVPTKLITITYNDLKYKL
jgi:predicted metal-dependent peptidase